MPKPKGVEEYIKRQKVARNMKYQKQFKSKSSIRQSSGKEDLDNSSEELNTIAHELVDPVFEIELNVDSETKLTL